MVSCWIGVIVLFLTSLSVADDVVDVCGDAVVVTVFEFDGEWVFGVDGGGGGRLPSVLVLFPLTFEF